VFLEVTGRALENAFKPSYQAGECIEVVASIADKHIGQHATYIA
jgi:hypothetical protein